MSRVPTTAKRRPAQRAANSPAVAGFRPASAAWAVAAAFVLQPQLAQAQPTGAQVIHGAATFAGSNGNLVVTTRNGAGTNHSAINWQSFSVPAGTITRFDQPSATSTSINRVVGADPSAIFGTLRSNGRLVLVNPAGIAVGAGAVVDTAGFTASTLPMTDADALAGRQAFGGAGGALQVDGTVIARSGDVVLVAPQVQAGANALIRSQGATVLAAGHKVAITGRGLEGIALEVRAGDQAVNLGTLQGDAVGIFAGTLHHSGVAQASAASVEGGKVVLKASGGDALVDGRIAASGSNGHGGSIDVLGRRVGLLAGASLDASGAAGGGQVRVGGDYQGHNAQVPNAARTYVDGGATIRADATQRGDGGRVIVWSDEATRMHGRISARGGAQDGDGGFAEVSGKQYLDFTGSADLRAPRGARGTLLLDPSDITITHNGPTTAPFTTSGTDTIFSDAPASSTIADGTLNQQLTSGNVQVKTSSSLASEGGQITLNGDATLSWTGSYGLGLEADAAILLDGTISGPAGSLTLIAHGGDIVGNGKIEVGSVFAQAGYYDAQAPAASVAGSVRLTNAANKIGAIAGSALGSTAEFKVRNAQALTIGSVSTPWGGGSGIVVTDGSNNAGKIDVATSVGALTLFGGEGATVAAGEVYIKAASSADGDVQMDSGTISVGTGPLDIQAGRDMHLGDKDPSDGSSTLSINSGGPISLTAGRDMLLGARVSGTGYYSSVSISGYGRTPATAITLNAGHDIDFGVVDSEYGPSTSIVNDQAPISITAGNSILGGVTLQTYGSSNADPLGGSVTMTATNGSLSFYSIDTGSYTEGANPLPSGTVKLSAKGSITGNAIYTEGGYGDSLGAGNGGAVTVTSSTGDVSIDTVETYGGEGGYSYSSLGSAPGGLGGSVAITAAGDVSVGNVDASGGYGYNGASGGNAGNVSITSTGGNIRINTSIRAYGGYAYGSSVGPANGGMGGTVTLTADAGSITAAPYADIAVDGGYGSGGGNGGAAGTVKVKVPNGAVTIESISAIGGDGDQGGSGGDGGDGGTVEVAAGGDLVMLPGYGFSVMADGGTSGQGSGGRGGAISLVSTGGSIVADSTDSEVPLLVPQTSGYGGVSANGGYGGTGGAGGAILMDAATDITTGGVYAIGGDSDAGGTGQTGGAGGSAHLRFANSLAASQVVVVGGTGDSGTNGGNGGAGGSIRLERTGATGDLVLDGTTLFLAYGGMGGDATFDAGGVGGTGGAGGTISLASAGGAVVLQSPVLGAGSGSGGLNADDSTYAQPGALGTLSTSGPVEVDGNLELGARWINTGTVNVRGSSVVYGGGIFANQGSLSLFDMAMVDTEGGVENQANGTITGSGSNVALHLVHNAGLLKVEAGSSLETMGFTSNAGTVLVDGTLAIGDDSTSCSRCTAMAAAAVDPAAGIFTNEAGGVVGGSGTISLGGGTGTLDNFGTLKPGGLGTIGTLTLDGNLSMESGSTLATDLVSTSSHDALVVSGAATSGGTIAVNYLQGAAFGVGDSFSVLQSAALDASKLPAVSAQELDPRASGNALLLVANAAYPPPPPPPAPAPAPAPAAQESAVQQVNNQVVTFAQLFVQEAQRQEDDHQDGPAGKDDIVISDNACKPS